MKSEVIRLLKNRFTKPVKNKITHSLELDMKYICKNTIQKRKAIYGNNFPQMAELQSEYLGRKVTPREVAMSLAILKKVRIDFIESKLQELKHDINFDTYIIQTQILDLKNGLEDSLKDFHNYLYIAQFYDEYERL